MLKLEDFSTITMMTYRRWKQRQSHLEVRVLEDIPELQQSPACFQLSVQALCPCERAKRSCVYQDVFQFLSVNSIYQRASKVISPFIIFAVFDVSFRRYKL